MKRISFLFFLLSLSPAAVFAGPYDQVYSIVTVEFQKSADFHLHPVLLNAVDPAP